MEIYIHRDNEEFGPYSREAALEYMKQGIFEPSNYGWHAGLADWMPLGELLEPAAPAAPQLASFAFQPQSTARPTVKRAPLQRSSTRTARAPRERKHTGAMIALNLMLILLAVGVGCFRFGYGREMALRYSTAIRALLEEQMNGRQQAGPPPSAMQARQPETAQSASTPLPTVAAPAPRAVIAQNPAPSPAFDPAELAGNPAEWPRTVMLKEDCVFPAIYNSQVVGSVKVPRGTMVRLVNIQGDMVSLDFQGGTRTLSWKLTDIEERAAHSPAPRSASAGNTAQSPP